VPPGSSFPVGLFPWQKVPKGRPGTSWQTHPSSFFFPKRILFPSGRFSPIHCAPHGGIGILDATIVSRWFSGCFHVTFQSDRHFHFLVSSKVVGFMIYNLKRFIGSCFDVYFFLWSNGAPHWEREKFLWEQEQLKEWTHLQSKRNKKGSVKEKSQKRVRFAPDPIVFMAPQENSFKVEDLLVPTTVPISSVFGRLRVDLASPAPNPPPLFTACSSGVDQIGSQISNSNL
jgi:hypothetical protein